MFVIVIRLGGERTWKVYSTEKERTAEFERLKNEASRSGCGSHCDCYYEYANGKAFVHCGGCRTELVPHLDLLPNEPKV